MPAANLNTIPEFDQMFTRLRASLKPKGPIEHYLVRQLAAAQFKSRHYERVALGVVDYQRMDAVEDFTAPDNLSKTAQEGRLLGLGFVRDSNNANAQWKVSRIETAAERSFHQNLRRLQLVQSARRASPED